jgi:hypothetical protein
VPEVQHDSAGRREKLDGREACGGAPKSTPGHLVTVPLSLKETALDLPAPVEGADAPHEWTSRQTRDTWTTPSARRTRSSIAQLVVLDAPKAGTLQVSVPRETSVALTWTVSS